MRTEKVVWMQDSIRFVVAYDCLATFDDCYGDTFNREVNPDITEERMACEEQEARESFYPEVCAVEIKCPLCGNWEVVDSIGACVGYDWDMIETEFDYFKDMCANAESKLAEINARLK